MDTLAGVGIVVLLIAGMGAWLYGVLHPLLNHGRAGVALLGFVMPWVALLYAVLHRCPPPPAA